MKSTNLNSFLGRNKELQQLVDNWLSVKNGSTPKVVTIIGDTGYGKTRLVAEFYSQIVHENPGYWPPKLATTPDSIDLNPCFRGEPPTTDIPFLWWGMRCQKPNHGRNNVQDEGCSLTRSLPFLRPHCIPAYTHRLRNEKIQDLKGKSIDEALNLLGFVPALGNILTFIQSAKGLVDAGKSALDLKKIDGASEIHRLSADSLADQSLGFLRSFLDPTEKELPTIPVVIVIDDAQWADPVTLKCLHGLIEFAVERKSPLLVLATHWESEWKASFASSENVAQTSNSWRNYRQISEMITRHHPEDSKDVFVDLHLGKLDCKGLVDAAFPKIGAPVTAHIVKVSDGNPLITNQMLSVLADAPAWWFVDNDLNQDLTSEGVKEFLKATRDIPRLFKERVHMLSKSNEDLCTLLSIGSLCASGANEVGFDNWFVGPFSEELFSRIRSQSGSLQTAENPHNVISISMEGLSIAEFRHRNFPEEFLKITNPKMKQDWVGEITNLLCEWIRHGKLAPNLQNQSFFSFAEGWLSEIFQANPTNEMAECLSTTRKHLAQIQRAIGNPEPLIITLSRNKELLEWRLDDAFKNLTHGKKPPAELVEDLNKVTCDLAMALSYNLKAKEGLELLNKFNESYAQPSGKRLEVLPYLLKGSQRAALYRTLASLNRAVSIQDGYAIGDYRAVLTLKEINTKHREKAASFMREAWIINALSFGLNSSTAIRDGLEFIECISEGAENGTLRFQYHPIIALGPLLLLARDLKMEDKPLWEMALMVLSTSYLSFRRWEADEFLLLKELTIDLGIHPEFLGGEKFDNLEYQLIRIWEERASELENLRELYPGPENARKEVLESKKARLGEHHPETLAAELAFLECPINLNDNNLITFFKKIDVPGSPKGLVIKSGLLLVELLERKEAVKVLKKMRIYASDYYGPGSPHKGYFKKTTEKLIEYLGRAGLHSEAAKLISEVKNPNYKMNMTPTQRLNDILDLLENPAANFDFDAKLKEANSLLQSSDHDVVAAYFCWKLMHVSQASEFVKTTSQGLLAKKALAEGRMDGLMGIGVNGTYAFNGELLPQGRKRKTSDVNLIGEFEIDFSDKEQYRKECEVEDEKSRRTSKNILANLRARGLIEKPRDTSALQENITFIYQHLTGLLKNAKYGEAAKECWNHEIIDEEAGRNGFMKSDLFWDLVRKELPSELIQQESPSFRRIRSFISETQTSHDGPLWGDRIQPHTGEVILALAASKLGDHELLEFAENNLRSEFFAALSACLLLQGRPRLAIQIFAERVGVFSPKSSPKPTCLMIRMLSNSIPDLGTLDGDPRDALQTLQDMAGNYPLWRSQNGQDQQVRSLGCIIGAWLRLGDIPKVEAALEIYRDVINSFLITEEPEERKSDMIKNEEKAWIQAAVYFFLKEDREKALEMIRHYLLRSVQFGNIAPAKD